MKTSSRAAEQSIPPFEDMRLNPKPYTVDPKPQGLDRFDIIECSCAPSTVTSDGTTSVGVLSQCSQLQTCLLMTRDALTRLTFVIDWGAGSQWWSRVTVCSQAPVMHLCICKRWRTFSRPL